MSENVIKIDGAAISSVTDLCRQVACAVRGPKAGYGDSVESVLSELKDIAEQRGSVQVFIANSGVMKKTFGRRETTNYCSNRFGGAVPVVRDQAVRDLNESVLEIGPTLYERLVLGIQQVKGVELELA